MELSDLFANQPANGSLEDMVSWFIAAHLKTCLYFGAKSAYYDGSIEGSIGPYCDEERRQPYLALRHTSGWGPEDFEQVAMDVALPDCAHNNGAWWRTDTPDDPISDWLRFCKESRLDQYLSHQVCAGPLEFGEHHG